MEIFNYNFTLGSDPEVAVRHKASGNFICPHKLIGGTKRRPVPLGDEGNTIQLDGFAAELGIPPCHTREEFVHQHKAALRDLNRELGRSYEVVITPTANFSKKEIDNAPEECKELGCDPDYNAYVSVKGEDGKVALPAFPETNPRPSAEGVLFRTFGGHVHVGWNDTPGNEDTPEHIEACRLLTVAMDYYLGAVSTICDPDAKRRELYGKAGAFRPKPYGMEYRSMSNWWLRDDETVGWVYDRTIQSIKQLWDRGPNYVKKKAKEVGRFSINTGASPVFVMEALAKEKDFEQMIGICDV